MGNGFKWEDLTSKPVEDLTTDEKLIVIIGKIAGLESSHRSNKADHDRFYKSYWLCLLGIPGIFAVLTIIVTILIQHIGK
jgi:hypothetical protein